jgi:hypothetical protein
MVKNNVTAGNKYLSYPYLQFKTNFDIAVTMTDIQNARKR